MADGGRGKKEGNSLDGGALGLLIGQRALGRGEWHLGEAGLVRGDTTAAGGASRRRAAWRGGVAARESARDACERGKVPRGRPGGAGGVPRVHLAADAPWTRSTGGVRRAAAKQSKPGGERWR